MTLTAAKNKPTQYTVKKINNPTDWESFLDKQEYQIFVQSPGYAEFNQSTGDPSFFLGLYENNKLIGGSLVIHVHAKRGDFYYLPYGPLLDYSQPKQLQSFTDELKALAKKNKINFIRVSPFQDNTAQANQTLKASGYKKAPMHMIAETTWILDLNPSTEDLLKNMRQNHRNLIRRAERDGVVVTLSDKVEDIHKLYDLLKETAQRHNFHPYPLDYLIKEFQAFQSKGQARMYLAHHEGDLLAISVMYFYKNTAVYRHGASNMLKPKVPASYAIQWQAIQDAKDYGCKFYNFWGIAPEDAKKHPFLGITRFKKGFSGFQKDLLHAHDLPTSWKYIINWTIETIRRMKRGF